MGHHAAAAIVFAGAYVVFAFGKLPGMKIDRPGAAIIGAVLMVALRVVEPSDALRSVDFATIVLLFSMMLLVGGLRLAGFFDWLTSLLARRLQPHLLLPAVIFTAGVLSAFFVNDVVCLLLAPFVLSLAAGMSLPPMPYVLALATASNIGSVATITGNPQNMLIGSYSGIGYMDFLLHLAPVAVAGMLLDWAIIAFLFRREHRAVTPENARPIGTSKPATKVEPMVSPLNVAAPSASRLLKPVIVTIGVLAGFVAGFPPALVAAVGAAVLLIERNVEPKLVYDEVDWGLLVFFAGVFVIVRGAEMAGISAAMLNATRALNLHQPPIFSIVVAALSNVVSNVPAVMLLKSIVPGFANPHTAWLMLAMASTLAGNLTITGSVANIIVVERAKPAVHVRFRDYFRVGLPVTVATIALGTAWLYWVG